MENYEISSENTLSLPITELRKDVINISYEIYLNFRKILSPLWIESRDFNWFLENILHQQPKLMKKICYVSYENNIFSLYNNQKEKLLDFSQNDINSYIAQQLLWAQDIKIIETRVAKIQEAIDSIYDENHGWIYNSDLDDDDRVKNWEYAGKNMSELRELLDTETQLLFQVYELKWETQKKVAILKKNMQFFAGVGDKYESWAHYFKLSKSEIQSSVKTMIQNMENSEIFEYIRWVNRDIYENGRRSKMTDQVNAKLVQALYSWTFEKLKTQRAPDEDFFELARVMTWRKTVIQEFYSHKEWYGWKSETEVQGDIDTLARDIELANYVLLYVMHREWWVFDALSDQIDNLDLIPKDPAVWERSPFQVIQESTKSISWLWSGGENLLKAVQLKWSTQITSETKYEDLSFDERLSLGTLARIGKYINKKTSVWQNNPIDIQWILQDINWEIEKFWKESLDAMSTDLEKQMKDVNLLGFFSWIDTKSLWIETNLSQILDLYQDINWWGVLNISDRWKDRLTPGKWALLLAGSLVAAAVIIGIVWIPALATAAAGAGTIAGAKVLLGTWAGIWFTVWALDILLSSQAYDSVWESIAQHGSRLGVNTILGAWFFYGSARILWSAVFTDPFLSASNFKDIGYFWGGETLVTSFIAEPIAQSVIMDSYKDDYIDTDSTNYQ